MNIIDFNRLTICGRNNGGKHPRPTMPYLRKNVETTKDGYSYSFVLPYELCERVKGKFGEFVCIGFYRETGEIAIVNRQNDPTRVRKISKSGRGESVGQISFADMKKNDTAKNMYGDHKRVYFDIKEGDDGFLFIPNGQVYK